MAQIRQVVSESLQATVRRLLPSQQGFTEDLQASNVIQPIIDLTPTAEGSLLDTDLARAAALGSQTAFDTVAGSGTTANTAGFWRFIGAATVLTSGGGTRQAHIEITDGVTTKIAWMLKSAATSIANTKSESFDLVFYLNTGETINVFGSAGCTISGSYRQVADVNGNLISPSGFVSQ